MNDAEIDAKVAERVMGWRRYDHPGPLQGVWYWIGEGHPGRYPGDWRPTRDYNHVREMEDEIERRGLTAAYYYALGQAVDTFTRDRGENILRATARERCLAALEVCNAD